MAPHRVGPPFASPRLFGTEELNEDNQKAIIASLEKSLGMIYPVVEGARAKEQTRAIQIPQYMNIPYSMGSRLELLRVCQPSISIVRVRDEWICEEPCLLAMAKTQLWKIKF